MRTTPLIILLIACALFLLPAATSAHEAYVLPGAYFWQEIGSPANLKAFDAWESPHNVQVTLEVVSGALLLIAASFLFRRSGVGKRYAGFLERFAFLGPVFIRVTIAAAFFLGAQSNAFLGPELSIGQMPLSAALRAGLYASSVMILFGVFTEVAALIGLAAFTIGFFAFGAYLGTYLNYLGELVVLLLFGARRWSVDGLFRGPLGGWRRHFARYETAIVRVLYGTALLYAAVSVKLLHADMTLRVIRDWNLTQFHWLFPSDPLLVALGAGLAELAIGLCIVIGFELRLTVLVSLFYITLSLIYFRELVWPHLLLYGISLNLLVQPETLTIDQLLFPARHTRE